MYLKLIGNIILFVILTFSTIGQSMERKHLHFETDPFTASIFTQMEEKYIGIYKKNKNIRTQEEKNYILEYTFYIKDLGKLYDDRKFPEISKTITDFYKKNYRPLFGQKPTDFFPKMNQDVLAIILNHLPNSADLAALSSTCNSMNVIIRSKFHIFHTVYDSLHDKDLSDLSSQVNNDGEELYPYIESKGEEFGRVFKSGECPKITKRYEWIPESKIQKEYHHDLHIALDRNRTSIPERIKINKIYKNGLKYFLINYVRTKEDFQKFFDCFRKNPNLLGQANDQNRPVSDLNYTFLLYLKNFLGVLPARLLHTTFEKIVEENTHVSKKEIFNTLITSYKQFVAKHTSERQDDLLRVRNMLAEEIIKFATKCRDKIQKKITQQELDEFNPETQQEKEIFLIIMSDKLRKVPRNQEKVSR